MIQNHPTIKLGGTIITFTEGCPLSELIFCSRTMLNCISLTENASTIENFGGSKKQTQKEELNITLDAWQGWRIEESMRCFV